jgi:CRISPR system Cascade subunit CasD
MQWLLFTYRAPLAAHGGPDWGRTRPTGLRPTRSGLLGLVANCLGIDRHERERQRELSSSLGVAVRSETAAAVIRDFHTAQVPTGILARGGPTRAAELARGRLVTTPTDRDYLADGLHTVALWQRTGATVSLAEIEQALRRPASIPFAGRMACPFSQPPNPTIIEADTLVEALGVRPALAASLGLKRLRQMEIAADADCNIGIDPHLQETKRDEPVGLGAYMTRQINVATQDVAP